MVVSSSVSRKGVEQVNYVLNDCFNLKQSIHNDPQAIACSPIKVLVKKVGTIAGGEGRKHCIPLEKSRLTRELGSR